MNSTRVAVIVPEGISLTAEEIAVDSWLKRPGDSVRRGEPIAEIRTDKATLELEATESGTLSEIVAEAGTEVKVGETIGWLEVEA